MSQCSVLQGYEYMNPDVKEIFFQFLTSLSTDRIIGPELESRAPPVVAQSKPRCPFLRSGWLVTSMLLLRASVLGPRSAAIRMKLLSQGLRLGFPKKSPFLRCGYQHSFLQGILQPFVFIWEPRMMPRRIADRWIYLIAELVIGQGIVWTHHLSVSAHFTRLPSVSTHSTRWGDIFFQQEVLKLLR